MLYFRFLTTHYSCWLCKGKQNIWIWSDIVLRRALFDHSAERSEELPRNPGSGKLPYSSRLTFFQAGVEPTPTIIESGLYSNGERLRPLGHRARYQIFYTVLILILYAMQYNCACLLILYKYVCTMLVHVHTYGWIIKLLHMCHYYEYWPIISPP